MTFSLESEHYSTLHKFLDTHTATLIEFRVDNRKRSSFCTYANHILLRAVTNI